MGKLPFGRWSNRAFVGQDQLGDFASSRLCLILFVIEGLDKKRTFCKHYLLV